MRSLLLITLLTISINLRLKAQSADTTHYLMDDVEMQIESSEALNSMYNFKFSESTAGFNAIKAAHPRHPLPYFLLGLQEFWKYLANDTNESIDKRFIAYMDSSIYFAEKMFDANENNTEARFFLAAAYGFKGRLFADRGKWVKAAGVAKGAYKYLPKKGEGPNQYSTEFLFGDGIANYYSVWLPENYSILKPVVMVFGKGEKGLGIKQLTEVANNAFYTRVEAQTYLMDIYFTKEEPIQPQKALPYIKYLSDTYPDNPYFQRFYMRITYSCGQITETERVAKEVLEKTDNKYPFYDAMTARYACFYLGYIQRYRYANRDKAKEYLKLTIKYSEELKMYDSGFYWWSMAYIAQMAIEEKDNATAKEYYEKVKKYADKGHTAYNEAKEWLKKN